MIIKRHKSTMCIGALLTLFFIVLGVFMLYCELNYISISKDGSHKILYIIVIISIVAYGYELCVYYFKRMVVCEDTIFIYRIRKPILTLSSNNDILKVEIFKRKVGRKSNRIHIYDNSGREVFSDTISDKECVWLEDYFKQRVKLRVERGFE